MGHTRFASSARLAPQRVVSTFAICAAIIAPLLAAPEAARAFDRDSELGLILSFHATFTDGSSGIYRVALIPEPSAAALLAPALVVLSRRQHHQR